MLVNYLKDFFGGECYIIEVNDVKELVELFDTIEKDINSNEGVKKEHKPNGTTTRAVDEAIQILFECGVCIVPTKDLDTFRNINNEELMHLVVFDDTIEKDNGVKDFLDKIASRLEYEHKKSIKYKMKDDFIRIILEDGTDE